MTTKEYILYISLVINIILGWWIYDMTKNDQQSNEDLLKSQGRVEILEQQLAKKDSSIVFLEQQKDSVQELLSQKPKERIIIKDRYNEKITSIIRLPLDSSVSYLSDRLSKVRVD